MGEKLEYRGRCFVFLLCFPLLPFLPIHSLYELLHPGCAFLFHLLCDVAVNIQRKGCCSVSQVLLDGFDVVPGLGGYNSIGVAEIMETGFRASYIGNSIVYTPGGVSTTNGQLPAHTNNFLEIMTDGSARMRILLLNNDQSDSSVNMIYARTVLGMYIILCLLFRRWQCQRNLLPVRSVCRTISDGTMQYVDLRKKVSYLNDYGCKHKIIVEKDKKQVLTICGCGGNICKSDAGLKSSKRTSRVTGT